MANRGRLLLAGAMTVLLVACQPASASPSRTTGEPSGGPVVTQAKPNDAPAAPAAQPVASAAKVATPAQQPPTAAPPKPAAPPTTVAQAKPAAPPTTVAQAKPAAQPARQTDASVPGIALQELPFGFRQPLFLTHAGDGTGRRFVVERGGTIRVIQGEQLLPSPFLDVSSKIRTSGTEQGLLGLAFHPRYAENGRFFVNYTDTQGRNTVERYQVSTDPNRGDPSTGVKLLALDDPAPNHNGGMVLFGPDGKLWVGWGDGGASGDRYQNGQNKQALLGKMLRLDVDSGEPYGIPADNPYIGNAEYRPEIWAMGMRNPWRYSFDRATGDLWIGDVGQNAFEEIHLVTAGSAGGLNFGWPIVEGLHCYPIGAQCDQSPYERPVAEYGRDGGCSVTGGYVYRGPAYPSLHGLYFFGDFCTGRIWSLDRQSDGGWRMTEQVKEPIQISSFGEDEAGELYVTTFSGSDGHKIYRVVPR